MRVFLATPYSTSSATGVASFVRLIVGCVRGHGGEVIVVEPSWHRGLGGAANAILALHSVRELFRRREQVDAVHCQQLHLQSLATGLAARVLGKPVVLTVHGRSPRPPGSRGLAFRVMERWGASVPHRLIVVAQDLNRQLGTVGAVVPIGVPVEALQSFREERVAIRRELGVDDAFVVLFSGRVTVDKGIRTLLGAFDAVRRSSSRPLRLVLVGPVASDLRFELDGRTKDGDVLVTGQRNDAGRVLCAADLFVLPSTREGLPFSVLEAMAAGVPVIATRVGDIPEVVRPQVTGLLVPPGDAGALADALRWALARPSEMEAMAARGLELVASRYDVSRMCAAYRALYAEVAPSARWRDSPGHALS